MLSLITAPATEPLDWFEAKRHLRLDGDQELELVAGTLIPASRIWLEGYTARQLITATWTLSLCAFPEDGVIRIPLPPLQSVTSVQYVDLAGATQTFAAANYVVEAPAGPYARPGRITLAYGALWPPTLYQEKSVTVTFKAGYGDEATAVPKVLVQAMLLMIGQTFEHREQGGIAVMKNVVTAELLADPFRVLAFD